MILSNALFTLKQVVTKPYFLLPTIVVLLVSAIVSSLGGFVLERPAVDYILYADQIPSDNIIGYLFFNYPIEIGMLLLLGLVMSVVTFIGMLCVVMLANGEKFSDAINESIKAWKKSAALTIIFILALLIAGVSFIIIGFLGAINPILLEIAMTLVFIVLAIILIKMLFVIPALAENDAKEAIKKSWDFTQKKFWRSFALLIVTIIISGIGVLVFQQIGIMLGETFELPFYIIAEAFGSTYFVAAITNYFYTKRK